MHKNLEKKQWELMQKRLRPLETEKSPREMRSFAVTWDPRKVASYSTHKCIIIIIIRK